MKRQFGLVLSAVLLSAGCGPTTVDLTGDVFDLQTGMSVAGFKACLYGSPDVPCAMSNQTGVYSLPVPKNANHLIELTHPDYFPYLRSAVTTESAVYIHGIPHIKTPMWQMLGGIAGGLDASKGQLSFEIFKDPFDPKDRMGGIQGAKIEIEPKVGTIVMMDVDMMGNLMPNPPLQETSPVGIGLILNVPVGDYSIKVTPPAGKTCRPEPNYTWQEGGVSKVRSVAGHHTFGALVVCK